MAENWDNISIRVQRIDNGFVISGSVGIGYGGSEADTLFASTLPEATAKVVNIIEYADAIHLRGKQSEDNF